MKLFSTKSKILSLIAVAIFSALQTAFAQSVHISKFGRTATRDDVSLIVLKNKGNSSVSLINYGATLVGMKVPNRNGKFDDIVLGFNSIAEYENQDRYFGCTLVRYGARIENTEFKALKLSAMPSRHA